MPIKQKKSKRIFYILLGVVALGIFGAFAFRNQLPQAQAASFDLHGWAWSSHIGWVEFNCEDVSVCGTANYKVVYDDVSGNLTGYAWSSSIGWINFNPSLTGAPDSAGAARVVNAATGEVRGWIRACTVFLSGCAGSLKYNAYRGGWDGWIKLSGANHVSPNLTTDNNNDGVIDGGVTLDQVNRKFIGNAWGGEVVGWLNFNNSRGGVTIDPPQPLPAADIRANGVGGSINIASGSSAQITWCGSPASLCANAVSCSVSSSGGPTWTGTSGTRSTGPLSTPTTYTLSCTNAAGTATDTVTVNVSAPSAPDLEVSVSPSIKSGSLVVGSAITFQGTVRNSGDTTAGGTFTNRFLIDLNSSSFTATDVILSGDSITALATGASRVVDSDAAPWTAVLGTHTVRLAADDPSSVNESDESNNFGDRTFTISSGGGGGGGSFTIDCVDVLAAPDIDPPCDIVVLFSPALDADSTLATLTINPQGGFASNVVFSILDITENAGGYVMPSSRYSAVYTNVTPPSTANPPYPKDITLTLIVSKLEADPDVDRIFTVRMRASGGGHTEDFNLRLRLKASSPGGGEE